MLSYSPREELVVSLADAQTASHILPPDEELAAICKSNHQRWTCCERRSLQRLGVGQLQLGSSSTGKRRQLGTRRYPTIYFSERIHTQTPVGSHPSPRRNGSGRTWSCARTLTGWSRSVRTALEESSPASTTRTALALFPGCHSPTQTPHPGLKQTAWQ